MWAFILLGVCRCFVIIRQIHIYIYPPLADSLGILALNANQEEDMQRKAGEHHEDGCSAKLRQSVASD